MGHEKSPQSVVGMGCGESPQTVVGVRGEESFQTVHSLPVYMELFFSEMGTTDNHIHKAESSGKES